MKSRNAVLVAAAALTAVVTTAINAGAQPAQVPSPSWIVDAKTGCEVWDDVPQPNETVTWSGACENSRARGNGVMQWFENGKPGDRYEGEVRDGKLNGHGVFAAANGDRCDCEWHDGTQTGHGIYTFANGNRYKRYEGEFSSGKMNGHGVLTWTNGDRYEGEFRDNEISGHGVLTFANGDRYDGEWRDGMANGIGSLVNKRGTFNGPWVNGCLKSGIRAWVGVDPGSCR